MPSIHAQQALLPTGWHKQVRVEIDDGLITQVQHNALPREEDTLLGYVMPGMPNSHSHAFQRALAGRTENRSSGAHDNFWSWRELMYNLVRQLDAGKLQAIATQLYIEMVCAGYTSVTEFHYLHRDQAGRTSSDSMLRALIAASATAGIRLHYVPVYYAYGNFGRTPPASRQERFVLSLPEFLAHYESARKQCRSNFHVGLGAHSLRAVDPDSLQELTTTAKRDSTRFHIHVAEQAQEVQDAVSALGSRPVRWLLDHYAPDSRWCLVHATHMESDETADLAQSEAVVCLCPSTEANLGDGLFPLSAYLNAGGSLAIGSDSHVTIAPFEELRWLEYGQRLQTRSRNVAAQPGEHCGANLIARCLTGGAQANALAESGLMTGAPADLIELDPDHPMLVEQSASTLSDALVFTGLPSPIANVMVAGQWQLQDRCHPAAQQAARAYAQTLSAIDWTHHA